MSQSIQLSNGQVAKVSKEDFYLVAKYTWFVSTGYAYTRIDGEKIAMHRLINKTPKGKDTDHINGDTLDNRRQNLRTASRSLNMANIKVRKKRGATSSIYKGVIWHKKNKIWRARIKVNYKAICLGCYADEKEAAAAYDAAALKYFGSFARTNGGKS